MRANPQRALRARTKRALDDVPRAEIGDKRRRLQRAFKCYVALALASHVTLAALTAVYIVVWQHTGYVAVLYARVLVVVRIVLLVRVLSIRRIDVVVLVGVRRYHKVVRHFKRHPALALWLWVGFVDLYVLRYKAVLIDVLHFALSGPADTLQFPAYVLLDVLYIVDFHLTFYLVYWVGTCGTVDRLLLAPHRRPRGGGAGAYQVV
ncbi:hypothetical protein LCGC14_2027140 [marine sediment metagenome]|uniref:Uncharacterized protein n=1 Tax=marine sediment metagenome TaxID=412755 RepID=A0A0F9EVT4_9ZZZZ